MSRASTAVRGLRGSALRQRGIQAGGDVVDPAREGLHADVVKAIRANQRITRLVYVSCNPTVSLVRDAALFCSPPTKRYTGRPFRITSAQPVDMFPLTNHCEMVMTFDRLSENEM